MGKGGEGGQKISGDPEDTQPCNPGTDLLFCSLGPILF